jgi:hypothetical protein
VEQSTSNVEYSKPQQPDHQQDDEDCQEHCDAPTGGMFTRDDATRPFADRNTRIAIKAPQYDDACDAAGASAVWMTGGLVPPRYLAPLSQFPPVHQLCLTPSKVRSHVGH